MCVNVSNFYMKIINNKHTLLYNLPTIHLIQRYNGLCELINYILWKKTCWNATGWRANIYSTFKIIPFILLSRFKRRHSAIQTAYSLYGLLFLICSKMVTHLLEKSHIYLTLKRRFLWKFIFATFKIISVIPLPQLE